MKYKGLLLLLNISLFVTACNNSSFSSLSSKEKYYVVNKNTINLSYNGGSYSEYNFNGGVLKYTGLSFISETYDYDVNRKTISCAYYTASGNLFYVHPSVGWYEMYLGNTKNDFTSEEQRAKFNKPQRPTSGYELQGEYGNGWIKFFNNTNTYYVTLSYAKQVGMNIIYK